MSHNERRAGKALIAMRGPGGQVRVRTFPNEFAETNWVTAQIADALAAGTPPAEILALAQERGMRPSRCSARSRMPASRTACSARSGCTSAPRSATRSRT